MPVAILRSALMWRLVIWQIGLLTEPHIKGHRADIAIGKVWVAQEPVRAREAPAEHERREGEAFVLEELVNIPWCHAVASRG